MRGSPKEPVDRQAGQASDETQGLQDGKTSL
jgi:hypothetical protein